MPNPPTKPTNIVWLPMADVLKIAQRYVEKKYKVPTTTVAVYSGITYANPTQNSTSDMAVSFSSNISIDNIDVEKIIDELKDRKIEPDL